LTNVSEEHVASIFRFLALAYSSTLKMEATCSSEMSVDFQWATQHYIPEDRTLHDHDCVNLRSKMDLWKLLPFSIGRVYRICDHERICNLKILKDYRFSAPVNKKWVLECRLPVCINE
jgi:hypothetical protein